MFEPHIAAASLVLAAGDGSNASTDPLNILLSYGPLGLIVLAFIMGWIHPGTTVRRLEKQIEEKDAVIKSKDEQIVTLQSAMVNDTIPALVRSNDILHDFPDLERRIGENLQQLREDVIRWSGKMERG